MERAELSRALTARYPWLDDPAFGPRRVEAGECDRCAAEARMLQTCGPDGGALGRRCALRLGEQAWCTGHEEEARRGLEWLRHLPADADVVARLWWVATGEVRVDPSVFRDLQERAGLDAGPEARG